MKSSKKVVAPVVKKKAKAVAPKKAVVTKRVAVVKKSVAAKTKPAFRKVTLTLSVPETAAVFVAGDFNDWTEKATDFLARRVHAKEAFNESAGAHPRTFPGRAPLLKLDRIYFRDLEVRVATVLTGKPWNKLSDHAALYAEFSC